MMDNLIQKVALDLLGYIERENYSGYDPYDALQSPLFALPLFRSNKLLRFAAQQIVKRSPINLRPFLRIPKGKNPVTLGLCIQSYGYLTEVFPDRKEEFIGKAESLIDELEDLIPKGFSGACWGYEFDWEARNAKIPKYKPTVVATGIITNGLYEYNLIVKNMKCQRLIVSAANFVLNDLNRTYDGDTFCFSYSPFDKQKVYNASAKGVRLLAQAFAISRDRKYIKMAEPAVEYILNRQNADGSWFYADSPKSQWNDSYHTGYVLDCLVSYAEIGDTSELKQKINAGFDYFNDTFLNKDGSVKTYADKLYPIDCTSVGQTVLTLCRFNNITASSAVLLKMIDTMYDRENHFFYYRKNKTGINTSSFMRWSQVWMIVALSYFLMKVNNENLD